MSGFADRAVGVAYGVGWSVVRRMPEKSAYAMFDRIADTMWSRQGKDVTRLESNLRRVVGPDVTDGELRVLSREGMRSYFRYWCDAFRLPSWSLEKIMSSIVIHDGHYLSDALAEGKGAVVALPHMGNWDHAGAWACIEHGGVVSVAERLQPEDLYEKFLEFRRSLGMDIIPLTGGEPPFPYLADRLREGKLVALLGDRDLSNNGVAVKYFGSRAKMPAGPAALAVDTGAALLTADLFFRDGKNHVRFLPPVVPPAEGERSRRIFRTVQLLADCYEQAVSTHPTDWHMLQRVWLDDLDPSKAPTS